MNEPKQNIILLKNNEIDKAKWDACIDAASNGLIYAYSFYLDTVSKHWDALVLNDYKAVMPLTWNRKYGINYLYQPFFTASLGVFGNNLSAEIIKLFLENIPTKFKYWDIYLNHGNLFPVKKINFYERTNYVLNLNKSYEKIAAGFSESHIRNIKKAQQSGCTVKKNIAVEDVISLAKKQSKKFSTIADADYVNFKKLYKHLEANNKAITYGVVNAEKKLIASCVYFFSHNKAYYILVGNHPTAKTSGASHFLINAFIEEHANEDLILDFEGSSIKSIAEFYRRFGATEEKYPGIKLNKLPKIIKLFKK